MPFLLLGAPRSGAAGSVEGAGKTTNEALRRHCGELSAVSPRCNVEIEISNLTNITKLINGFGNFSLFGVKNVL